MRQDRFQQLAKLIPDVSHETFFALCHYEDLLCKWQKHINLVANSTLTDIWQRHILDSAQLFPLQKQAKIWLDLGSGGGFPALVLACLLKQQNNELNQQAHIYLIESNGKKSAFLQQVIQELILPGTVYQSRIEDIVRKLPVPNVITARALSSLNNLCAFIAPIMMQARKGDCVALLQKGQFVEREIIEARQNWMFDLERQSSLVNKDSVVLLIRNIKKITPDITSK